MHHIIIEKNVVTVHSEGFDVNTYICMRLLMGEEKPLLIRVKNSEPVMSCIMSIFGAWCKEIPDKKCKWLGKIKPFELMVDDKCTVKVFSQKIIEFDALMEYISFSDFTNIEKICKEVNLPVYKYLYVDDNNLHMFIGDLYKHANSVSHAEGLVARLKSIRGGAAYFYFFK